jgi:hypothetical protein
LGLRVYDFTLGVNGKMGALCGRPPTLAGDEIDEERAFRDREIRTGAIY